MASLFNELQQVARDEIISGTNVLITGAGGVGKSFLLKLVKAELENKYLKNVAITSTTGVSANIIGGTTLHSYMGIGLGCESFKALYKKITEHFKYLARWKRLEVLIIDEVSMLSIELFEKLEKLARKIRGNLLPFGGIQLILTGDFLQLPNVKSDTFLFESSIWDKCIQKTVYLTQIVRQKDELFTRVLNKIRMGEVDDEVETILKSREIKYHSDDGIIPTMIYSTNAKVNATNVFYYNKLEGEEVKYQLKQKWFKKIAYKEKYDPMIRFEEELALKVGSQVIYLVNDSENLDLFNGARGVVKEFKNGLPVVLFNNGMRTFEETISTHSLEIKEEDTLVMTYTQLPLKLSWAVSCHRSQGCTLSLARIDFSKVFEYGQLYVALSRVNSLEGLYIRNLNTDLIKAHPAAVAFYKALEISGSSDISELPEIKALEVSGD
jgi:ATP-dependent DNA helicase PIF1